MSPWCRAIVAASADRMPGPLSVRTSIPIVSLAKGSLDGPILLEAHPQAQPDEEPAGVDLRRVRVVHLELDRGPAVADDERPSHLRREAVLELAADVEARLALALVEDGHARDRDLVVGEGLRVLGLADEARLDLDEVREPP